MIWEKIGSDPDEPHKINCNEQNNSADNQSDSDILNDSDCKENDCYTKQHVFDGDRTNITVLIVVDIEQ